jgi:CO/xanthine dehydrogenase Mo-binding subunit
MRLVPSVAGALGDAIFQAMGTGIRSLPMAPAGFVKSL